MKTEKSPRTGRSSRYYDLQKRRSKKSSYRNYRNITLANCLRIFNFYKRVTKVHSRPSYRVLLLVILICSHLGATTRLHFPNFTFLPNVCVHLCAHISSLCPINPLKFAELRASCSSASEKVSWYLRTYWSNRSYLRDVTKTILPNYIYAR